MRTRATRLLVLVLATSISALGVGPLGAVGPLASAQVASMFVSPDEGPPGSEFDAIANGFLAGEQVDFTWDGQVVSTVQANGSGAAADSLTVPTNAAVGQHAVGARGRQSGSQANTSFDVTPPPTTSTAAPTTTTTVARTTTTARATTTTTPSTTSGSAATSSTVPIATSEPPEVDLDDDTGDGVIGDADDAAVGQTEGGDDDGDGGLVVLLIVAIVVLAGAAIGVGVMLARQRAEAAGRVPPFGP